MLARMKRCRSRRRSAVGLSLLTLFTGAALATGSLQVSASPAPAEASSRWIRDYGYDFTGPQDDSK